MNLLIMEQTLFDLTNETGFMEFDLALCLFGGRHGLFPCDINVSRY